MGHVLRSQRAAKLAAVTTTAGLVLVAQFAVCRVAVGSYYWALMIAAVWRLPAPQPGETAAAVHAQPPAAVHAMVARSSKQCYRVLKLLQFVTSPHHRRCNVCHQSLRT